MIYSYITLVNPVLKGTDMKTRAKAKTKVVLLCQDEVPVTTRVAKPGDRCVNEACTYNHEDIPVDGREVLVTGKGDVVCDDFCFDEWFIGD